MSTDPAALNMLTSFARVVDVDRAARAAEDLAVCTGIEPVRAAQVIGMALSDPVYGLKRIHLYLPDLEAGTEREMLEEIEGQVGGAADDVRATVNGLTSEAVSAVGVAAIAVGVALREQRRHVAAVLRSWVGRP